MVLDKILGYPVNDINFEENVEFAFSNKTGKKIVCFEAKGTNIKDLTAPQHIDKKEHSTPLKQTWDYMGKLIPNNDVDYDILMKTIDHIRSKNISVKMFSNIFMELSLLYDKIYPNR